MHVAVDDRGGLTHNLVVESITDDRDEATVVYGRTATRPPGRDRSERARHAQARQVPARCTIANHENLGQYGTLTS